MAEWPRITTPQGFSQLLAEHKSTYRHNQLPSDGTRRTVFRADKFTYE
jgi:hypothetical protein